LDAGSSTGVRSFTGCDEGVATDFAVMVGTAAVNRAKAAAEIPI